MKGKIAKLKFQKDVEDEVKQDLQDALEEYDFRLHDDGTVQDLRQADDAMVQQHPLVYMAKVLGQARKAFRRSSQRGEGLE